MYNPKSLKAEEFINDGEILATLEYAEQNKNNVELIDSILEKAKPKKDIYKPKPVKKNKGGIRYGFTYLFGYKIADCA